MDCRSTKNINTLIFDLDGTLADTIPAIQYAVNNTRRALGFEPVGREAVVAGINRGSRHLVISAIAPEDKKNDDAYIDRVLDLHYELYKESYDKGVYPYRGIKETLEILKSRGYRLAVLSNKSDAFVKDLIHKLFGDGIFSYVKGTDKTVFKPDPALTYEVTKALGVEPSVCAMIGDSDIDILTAEKAGMTSVSVTWGYRSREFLESHGPDIIIDSPKELTELFS